MERIYRKGFGGWRKSESSLQCKQLLLCLVRSRSSRPGGAAFGTLPRGYPSLLGPSSQPSFAPPLCPLCALWSIPLNAALTQFSTPWVLSPWHLLSLRPKFSAR